MSIAGTRERPLNVPRRLPVSDGADTIVAGGGPTLWRLPSGQAAWSTPLVDAGDSVVAVIVATGGIAPSTSVVDVAEGPGWGASLERLASAGDGLRSDVLRSSGRARVVPLSTGEVVLVQPRFAWPVAGPPSLDGLVALVGRDARIGRTLAAIGGPADTDSSERPVDAATRQRVGPIYDQMREALRRGDFADFGRWLDRLGRVLGRVPESGRYP
jgi:hypothetical protein